MWRELFTRAMLRNARASKQLAPHIITTAQALRNLSADGRRPEC
jgi:hypothetical protein